MGIATKSWRRLSPPAPRCALALNVPQCPCLCRTYKNDRVPWELGQVPSTARPGPIKQCIAAASFQDSLAIDCPQPFKPRVLLVEVGALDPSKEDGHENWCPVHSGLTVDQNVRPGREGSEGRLFDLLQGLITSGALVRHRTRQLKTIPLCHATRTLSIAEAMNPISLPRTHRGSFGRPAR